MTRTEISQEMANKLTVFTSNPKNRCVGYINNTYQCRYSGKTLGVDAEACIVGLFLSEEDRLKADGVTIGTVTSLIKKAKQNNITIPDWFEEYEELLFDFQKIHDTNKFWDTNSLSDEGKARLLRNIEEHELVSEHFNHILNQK